MKEFWHIIIRYNIIELEESLFRIKKIRQNGKKILKTYETFLVISISKDAQTNNKKWWAKQNYIEFY